MWRNNPEPGGLVACEAPPLPGATRPPFLDEILGTLGWLDRTPAGILHIRTLTDQAKLFLHSGRIRGATGAGAAGLGARMRERGHVTQDALAEALRMQQADAVGAPLGFYLARTSGGASSALREVLREQLLDVIARCGAWSLGVLQFELGGVRRDGTDVAFDIAAVVEEIGAPGRRGVGARGRG